MDMTFPIENVWTSGTLYRKCYNVGLSLLPVFRSAESAATVVRGCTGNQRVSLGGNQK